MAWPVRRCPGTRSDAGVRADAPRRCRRSCPRMARRSQIQAGAARRERRDAAAPGTRSTSRTPTSACSSRRCPRSPASFIVDPRVEGKVNVVSTQPMTRDEVYEVFESVLRVHGYAAVPSGSMMKIVPESDREAGRRGVARWPPRPRHAVTRIIELQPRVRGRDGADPDAAACRRAGRSASHQGSQLAAHHRSRRQPRADRGASSAASTRPRTPRSR